MITMFFLYFEQWQNIRHDWNGIRIIRDTKIRDSDNSFGVFGWDEKRKGGVVSKQESNVEEECVFID